MSTGYPNRWGSGVAVGVGVGGTTKVTCPIAFPEFSVNQRLPSGPLAIPSGWLLAIGTGNSVMVPVGVILPTLFALALLSVNQRLPSGPLAMLKGSLAAVGMANSAMVPVE